MKKADLSRFLGWFLAYLPFGIALSPLPDIDLSSIRVVILAFLATWIVSGLARKNLRLPFSLSGLLIGTFLFLSAFSLFFARNQAWSLRKLAFFFSVYPVYWVFSECAQGRDRMMRFLKFFMGGAFAAAVIGIIQFLAQFPFGIDPVYRFLGKNVAPLFLGGAFSKAVLENPSWLVNVSGHTLLRAISFFPDPHMFSFYLGLAVPISVGLFLDSKRKGWLVVAGTLILADALTFSRGGYLGLFCAAIVLLGLFWRDMANRSRIWLAVSIAAIVAILLIPGPVADRFSSIFDLNEGSNAGRIETWKAALGVVSDHPVFGVGLGDYPLEIKPTADYREPIYAHSAYLDIAAETGLINAAVWISLMAALFFGFLRKSRNDAMFLWLAISLVVFAAHSMVETPLYSPAVMAAFMLIASLDNLKKGNDQKGS